MWNEGWVEILSRVRVKGLRTARCNTASTKTWILSEMSGISALEVIVQIKK